jgi:hypothetical protein
MEYHEIESFILSGCKFQYISYDHKKAADYYKNEWKGEKYLGPKIPQSYGMPKEIKEKFQVLRTGKLRQIEFSPNGKMWRFKIGAKYAKTYYRDDFGDSVKPILDPKQDVHKLIKRGLAVKLEEK